ncbi:antitoxin [Cellulomonas sp. JH27-2]|uniref:antitoxin n=1 Tax=Cellulomonas sp. JH27-2 TaxID=2774139 RepID=UPI0017864997|nr:antitoxin [Cellulomonas sp. JH27-2]MBD8057955.1 antitoxin [Cellulomonas sp. JH27-2]
MRTTLDIDDDVLAAARALAAHEGVSLGRAVSVLAQRGRSMTSTAPDGFPVFTAPAGHVITDDLVAAHLDDA